MPLEVVGSFQQQKQAEIWGKGVVQLTAAWDDQAVYHAIV